MKLRAVHLLTNLSSKRELRSIEEIRSFCKNHWIDYVQMVNPVWTKDVPIPREANDRPMALTPAHYGCYKAHKNAILQHLTQQIHALLIFECDACLTEGFNRFYKRVRRAYRACIEGKLDVFTFGPKHDGKTIDTVGTDVIVITQFIETHAYMIPAKSRALCEELFSLPWDAADFVWTVYGYDHRKIRIGTFNDRAVTYQCTGLSLIDGKVKTSENHWKWKIYDQ